MNPLTEQTKAIRAEFRAAWYKARSRGTRIEFQAHSSRVEVNEVSCVETTVTAKRPSDWFDGPGIVLNRFAAMARLDGLVLGALGVGSPTSLVRERANGIWTITLPVPGAELPQALWAAKKTRVIERKTATITVTEGTAGWTITGVHKTRTHHGKPQTFRCRVRRCGCAESRFGSTLPDRTPAERDELICPCPGKSCQNPHCSYANGHIRKVRQLVEQVVRTYS